MALTRNKRVLRRAKTTDGQPKQQRQPSWRQPLAASFLGFGMFLIVLNKNFLDKTLSQSYYSLGSEEPVSATSDGTSEHPPNFISDSTMSWCPSALMKAGAMTSPTGTVWTNLHHEILNATYKNLPSYDTLEGEVLQGYHEWIDMLFSFYKVSKLRASVMRPAPPKEIVQILKLADEIKLHNSLVSDEKDKRSLRVLVLGGSVTLGAGCKWPEGLGMKTPKNWIYTSEGCMWTSFLEKVVDDVIFEGQKIFKVENIAAGGQTSETGAVMLEYELYPNPQNVPDVIISAFSTNESVEPMAQVVFYEFMQKFVKVARNLHPCNDHAPLVVMAEDFFDPNGVPSRALEQSGRVYMQSQWHNLMAMDYSSMLKYKIYVEDLTYAPLVFSKYDMHHGVGMHMAMGWTLAFNFLNSIVNVCNDVQLENESHDLEAKEYQISDADRSDNQQSSDKFTIDPRLRPNLEMGEPSYHQVPSITYLGGTAALRTQFEENVATKKEYCEKLKENPDLQNMVKCPWYWFYSPMSGFSTREQVKARMDEVLIFNEGWAAEGRPIMKPRPGWYSHTPNSAFSVKIENVSVDVKHVVILSMKSYSPKWVGSKLGISTTVVKSATIPDSMLNRTSAVDWKEESIFYIDGYHDLKTSVHFPFTIPIQGGGAKAGESVIVDAKLVGGQEFKVAGIAVCTQR
eukprot:CAMPEP_0172388466 /NCGR_PEP_ID=MMETSP1061-20121228/5572_1 /TAXON_ID=37318 /ORGANISM="Pseudo-nitzschia pungens, Strain cf. pungens" /LENGTH=681 /DNA_ID=CAMNT_0013118367 /DNA_START=205 /DNA_END=2250 /DNA_ORIENTATION=-